MLDEVLPTASKVKPRVQWFAIIIPNWMLGYHRAGVVNLFWQREITLNGSWKSQITIYIIIIPHFEGRYSFIVNQPWPFRMTIFIFPFMAFHCHHRKSHAWLGTWPLWGQLGKPVVVSAQLREDNKHGFFLFLYFLEEILLLNFPIFTWEIKTFQLFKKKISPAAAGQILGNTSGWEPGS